MKLRFSERLKMLRENLGISQRELAKHVGVSSAMISLYETGKKSPTIEVLARFAEYFGVSSDYLLGLTDNPQPWNNDLPETVKRQLERLEELERKYEDLAAKIKKLSEEVDI